MLAWATRILLVENSVTSVNDKHSGMTAQRFVRNIAMPMKHDKAAHIRVLDNPILTPTWCLIQSMSYIDNMTTTARIIGHHPHDHNTIAMYFAFAQAICSAAMFTVDKTACAYDMGSWYDKPIVFTEQTGQHMSSTMRTLADEIMAASTEAKRATRYYDTNNADHMVDGREDVIGVFMAYSIRVLRATHIVVGEHIINQCVKDDVN